MSAQFVMNSILECSYTVLVIRILLIHVLVINYLLDNLCIKSRMYVATPSSSLHLPAELQDDFYMYLPACDKHLDKPEASGLEGTMTYSNRHPSAAI